MADGAARALAQEHMERLALGDRAAFAPLYAVLWPLCAELARRLLRDEAEGEDTAQRALLALFSRASEFDPRRSVVGWALALTSWECKSAVKRRLRRREEALEPLVVDGRPLPDERVARAEQVEAALAAFVRLSDAERATLREALTDEQAGPRSSSFRKRKQRALERWRAYLGEAHGRA